MVDKIRQPLAASKRPHKIRIDRMSETKDTTTGEITQTPTALDPNQSYRYASVEPLQGRELEYARQVSADVTHRVRLPWDPVICAATPKCSILFGTRRLQILSVLNIEERNIQLELLCREAV